MLSHLEFEAASTCPLSATSSWIARMTERAAAQDESTSEWRDLLVHHDFLVDQLHRCPVIDRSTLFSSLQECQTSCSEELFNMWWLRHRQAELDLCWGRIQRMPVADMTQLFEMREFIRSRNIGCATSLVFCLRYFRGFNCSVVTMLAFVNHYMDSPNPSAFRCLLRKRPAACINVASPSELSSELIRFFAGCIEQGLSLIHI